MAAGICPEHYGRWMDPFIGLSVAAAVTRRVKLGTGICLLPEREPIVTAKLIASLDVISGGRVVLGVGAGWLREETEVFGTNFGNALETAARDHRSDARAVDRKGMQLPGRPGAVPAGAMRAEAGSEAVPARSCSARWDPRRWSGWRELTTDGARRRASRKPSSTTRLPSESWPRTMAATPQSIRIEPFAAPGEDGISLDDLKRYKEAGVDRLILFSQRDAIRMAHGSALEVIRRLAPTVERAQHV